jgi:nicotinate phosphoribosyltransferase
VAAQNWLPAAGRPGARQNVNQTRGVGSVCAAMGLGLVTDLYELNMAASYLRRGMTMPATFSLFVRELPPQRGFLVAAGIEDCLDHLESFGFGAEDLEWMSSHGFTAGTVRDLSGVRFSGDVHAVSEGEVLMAGEPLLEVTAPLPEAQLVETFLLNQVTFQSAIATKAVRCTLAAGDMALVDFALRRTHGVEAGLAVARVSAMAGFVGTSNVEAARRFGLRAAGTMAHSYVEAFDNEEAAFAAFVEDLPGPYTFLVDTYDTMEGVEAAVEVVRRLHLDQDDPDRRLAVRIDSGDLAELARRARELLDASGLQRVGIFVSGALDEYSLEDLRRAGAPIDAAGVGTRVGVSADAPYLDSVYKLVAVNGRPVAKLSPGKESLPGAKQIWRRDGVSDVLARREEEGPRGGRALLHPVMSAGRRLAVRETLDTPRTRVAQGLAWLPAEARRIRDPEAPAVVISDALGALDRQTTERLRLEVLARSRARSSVQGT